MQDLSPCRSGQVKTVPARVFEVLQNQKVDLAKMAEEMIALVAGRKLDPMVEEVIGLEDIPGALARLQTRHVRGKIVAECA